MYFLCAIWRALRLKGEFLPIEWTTVDVIKTMQKIVARLSNRVFVGLPTCGL